MKRKLTKYFVIILAILLAELIHAYAQSFIEEYLNPASPYKSVVISMIIAVLVFYPAFHFISKYLKYTSKKYLAGAQKVTKKRIMGLMVGFVMALFLLFAAFSQIWYQKNPMIDIRAGIERMF